MNWNSRRLTKPKLRYYNMFKPTLEPEEYLFFKIPKYHRSLFAQFRAGILPLNIEVGRYRGEALEDRKCELCNEGVVEDEIHFLCSCTFYDNFRPLLFSKAIELQPDFESWDIIDKFAFLMGNLQSCVIKYLVKAVGKRKLAMYPN